MNRNILLILFIILLVLVGGYLLVRGNAEVEGESSATGDDRTLAGVVVEIDREQVPVDGPTLITVESEDGETEVVAVPSMGINLCEAQDNIADVFTLQTGATVEVRGAVGPEGEVVPCESADHYLRVIEAGGTGDAEEVSWESVDEMLQSGEVEMVAQNHNRQVWLTFEDGREVVTVEPEIDDIFEKVEACGAPCADILVATE